MSESGRHPHEPAAGVPDRLPSAELRELSVLRPGRALVATAVEWLAIAAAVSLACWLRDPLVYLAAVIFIGARQHALTVIGHDASHYRYLPGKGVNDLVANLLLMWPVFASVHGFRHFHGAHHRHLGTPRDGNRVLWKTHLADDRLAPEWVYPKTRRELLRVLLRRSTGLTGLRWVVRGILAIFVLREPLGLKLGRVAAYAGLATLLSVQGWWPHFVLLWLVPLCTWHITIQYIRLIAEHSAVTSEDPDYALTRTTIPTRLEAVLILPRNIGYHLEHHWYPSVPFYNLPALHARLMRAPRFRAHAEISPSVLRSLMRVSRKPRS